MLALADDPFAAEPRYEHPEAVEQLRRMYEQAARDLSDVQGRLGDPGGLPLLKLDDFGAYQAITTAWCRVYEMSVALNWLLLGEVPIYTHTGASKAEWVEHWFHGPWPRRP